MYFFKKYVKLSSIFLLLIFAIQSSFSQSRAKISGSVSDQFGSLPGAKVSIEGRNQFATTDVNGFYQLEVEEGDYVINSSFVMYNTNSKSISVSVGESANLDFLLVSGFSVDQPVSLGSRSKSRSLLKTTVPIDIISPEQIANSSQTELSQILQYLVPSFHSTHQTIADGTDHIDPSTLRGLGPDQVLVLINGKRRHNSALLNVNGTIGKGTVGTDFNAIPIGSIDRIEILRDGATSQYGSDAIAGVINIILKEQIQYINLDSRAGLNTENDGFTRYFGANFGLKLGSNGFLNITGEYRNREATNRAGNFTGNIYSNDQNEDNALILENDFFNQTGYDNRRVMEIGNSETQDLALAFNGELPVSDNAIVYFFGGRNYREGKAKGFYRFPMEQDRVVLELFPNGFSPEILTDIEDNSIVAGVKVKKNDWDIDFSYAIGTNTINYTISNSNNASLGIASPRTFNSGGFGYNQSTANFDLSRSFDWLKGFNLAFGGELRIENYEIIAGEEASYINGESTYLNQDGIEQPRIAGAQVFPGIQPENELSRFRTNSSVYADVEINTSDKLLLKGALRYESYNDFGGQTIWKIASRYRINNNLSLRSGISSGFRAPSLHQVYFQNISSQFINNEIVQVGTFNNESAVARDAFKIGLLKPELSQHFSFGLTGKIKDEFTFSFDLYQINIEDRIVLSGQFAEGYEDILEPFHVSAAQFFTNAIDSETTGFDIVLNYKDQIYNGQLSAYLAANVSKTRVDGKVKVPSSLINQEDILFNREEIARVEKGQPNFKLIAQLAYEFDKFKAKLNNTYFGEVAFIHPDDGDISNWAVNEFTGNIESRDQVFSPKMVTDLSLEYRFKNWLTATIGGNNIFNIYPDKHKHSENVGNGNFVYSRRVQQFGVKGANYFLRFQIKL